MIEVISGTDRPGANSLIISKMIAEDFRALGEKADVIDLGQLNLAEVSGGAYFKGAPGTFKEAVTRVNKADGLVIVSPEYNGSFPGILKLFMDYWSYPESYEFRPVAFVGVGNRWGGLRPVEHLQQVMGYRNAYVFPHRVFIHNVRDSLKEGKIIDPNLNDLLKTLSRDFIKFVRALKTEGLDANSKLGR